MDYLNFFGKIRFIGAIFFLCVLNNLYGQQFPVYRIDPAKAYGGAIADYFENVEYIPLETTKESLFGQVSDLIVTDSSYVINDFDTNAIFFFDTKGAFLTKYNIKGANLYHKISFDKNNNVILLTIYDNRLDKKSFTALSLKGKILRSINDFFQGDQFTSLSDSFYIVSNSCMTINDAPATDSLYSLLSVYKGDSLYKLFLPYRQNENLGLCNIGVSIILPGISDSGSIYVATPLEHKLFKVTKDTATMIGSFIFPMNRSLPPKTIYSDDKKFVDSLYPKVDEYNTILGVSNIYFINQYLFFKINTRAFKSFVGSEGRFLYNFIYDLKTNKLISLERITPDDQSYFLPILGNTSHINGLVIMGKYLYSDISSLLMFDAKDRTKYKNPQYPPVLQEYFKTQSRKSNPVIVRMKLKE
ncbi:6-bladed beta-propeller [Niabella insulamsoli]|uniref:6-bladed beta-propeller n=1 Tax=Niabella insulamsoli TaxID=3144874 RepID=UPI0031FCD122